MGVRLSPGTLAALVTSALMLAPIAASEPGNRVESVELGLLAHNVCVIDCKNAGKEAGGDVQLGVRFRSPDWLDAVGHPRPYAMISGNTAGKTSYVAAGLAWRIGLGDGWALEPSLGYALHDGEVDNPFRAGTPEAAAFARSRVLLGSRDLFRTGLALGRDLTGNWSVQIAFEHLSHGQILGNGRNQGMDNVGLRLVRRLSHE